MIKNLLQDINPVDEGIEFMPLMSLNTEEETDKLIELPEIIPILPLRGNVLFPDVVIPINVARNRSLKALASAINNNKIIGIMAQKNLDVDDPLEKDLYRVGTIAKVMKNLRMPDDNITIILQGKSRFIVKEFLTSEPFLSAKIEILPNTETLENAEFNALISAIKDLANQIISLSPNLPTEATIILKNIDNPEFLIHFITSNINIEVEEKQQLLETSDIKQRAEMVLKHLSIEVQMLDLKNQIQNKVRGDFDKQQRDYFLHQQLKTIQEELGDSNPDLQVEELKSKTKNKKWSKAVASVFEKELLKLERLNPMAPEHSIQVNYLELILELPWNEYAIDDINISKAEEILNKDHYGLDKVKNRILEHLAVLKLKGNMKAPILCFIGPPGVGKTSLGRSIAKALNRTYIRMSLGGLNDEAEIRGHRKTYIGAMPGRIIQNLKKAQISNPVFVLDEIDKVGNNYKGDPSSALLEVLDPEQNSSFVDNYLELEYDLSKIMFIATANSLATLHPALLDRMEIIEVNGYSTEEKLEIAKKYLVPKQREENGLTAKHLKIPSEVLKVIINEYTRESGVRELERKLAAVMRHVAMQITTNKTYNINLKINTVKEILGISHYEKDKYKNDNPIGVAIGLAWTQSGGDIIFVEVITYKGDGKLVLTGNLGDVMKESATTALSYLKANSNEIGINSEIFDKLNIHIHIPEGAIPKDGPSAGITMLSAIASALSGKKIQAYLCMSGEITLRGKVLPVGGIKEKVLAAKRLGLKTVMLSSQNYKDIMEIKAEFIKELKFIYVDTMLDVLKQALK